MSTASRYCGKAGGTCGGVETQHPSPGATGGTRGHYDPRAARQSLRPLGTVNQRLPEATNAAPPRKRVRGPRAQGACRPVMARPRMNRAPCAFFPIGLREPRLRHSLPPTSWGARGVVHGRPP